MRQEVLSLTEIFLLGFMGVLAIFLGTFLAPPKAFVLLGLGVFSVFWAFLGIYNRNRKAC